MVTIAFVFFVFFFNVGNLIIWSYKYFLHDFAVSIIYYFIIKKKILFIATEESPVGALYTCITLYVTSNSGYSGFLLHNFGPFLVFSLSDAHIP